MWRWRKEVTWTYRVLLFIFSWFWGMFVLGLLRGEQCVLFLISSFLYFVIVGLLELYRYVLIRNHDREED